MLFSESESFVNPLLQLKLCGYADQLTLDSDKYQGRNQLRYLGICYKSFTNTLSNKSTVAWGIFGTPARNRSPVNSPRRSPASAGAGAAVQEYRSVLYEHLFNLPEKITLLIPSKDGEPEDKVDFKRFFIHTKPTQYTPFTFEVVKRQNTSFSTGFGFYLMVKNDSLIQTFSHIIITLTKLLYLARIACNGIKAESYQLRMEQLTNATILRAYENSYQDIDTELSSTDHDKICEGILAAASAIIKTNADKFVLQKESDKSKNIRAETIKAIKSQLLTTSIS